MDNMIKNWEESHKIITDELIKLWLNHKESAPEELFKILDANDAFKKVHDWWEYSKGKYDAVSVDPFQIFASLYGKHLTRQEQKERAQILINVFEKEKEITSHDAEYFNRIVTPTASQLLSTRSLNKQIEIWDFFYRVSTQKLRGINELDFQKRNNWFGVNIESFSVALYWIAPDIFLPLETSTLSLLKGINAFDIKDQNPSFVDFQFLDYSEICSKLEELKIRPFDFVIFSRKVINSGGKTIKYTKAFSNFINHFKSKRDSFKKVEGVPHDTKKNQEEDTLNETIINSEFELVGFILRGEKKLINNLQPKTPYCFSDNYILEFDPTDKYSRIVRRNLKTEIYNIEESLKIQVNSIVGENGSGKSSISEALFQIINALSRKYVNSIKVDFIKKNINADLFFKSNTLIRIKIENDDITVYKYQFDEENNVYVEPLSRDLNLRVENSQLFSVEQFCYTIGVNYSLYGLNSRHIGNWIYPLFHKNDGYETPIVINPKREDGLININIENELAKNRLISNIVNIQHDNSKIEDVPFLLANKKPTSIKISINKTKLKEYNKNKVLNSQIDDFFEVVKSVFDLNEISESELWNQDLLKQYLYRKAIKICSIYPSYTKYIDNSNQSKSLKQIDGFVEDLRKDNSHVTFKFKQIISLFKFEELQKLYQIEAGKRIKTISFHELYKAIYSITRKINEDQYGGLYSNFKTPHFLPPALFAVDIVFAKGGSFDNLSSGEKQKIFMINTIIYHILNIDSVHNSNSSGIRLAYQNVLIVLDEIELYFHPEMQRRTICDVLEFLKRLKLDFIKSIQLIFITHSPFILSDIPSSNILRLKNGVPYNENVNPTFGANIHDLLANDFFLENGFMGEFAQEQINKTINWIIDEKRDMGLKESHKNLINIIGEPILKMKLMEMFDEACGENMEITFLKKRIEELNNKSK
jgi:predicted ATP-binding protein involved in virulence